MLSMVDFKLQAILHNRFDNTGTTAIIQDTANTKQEKCKTNVHYIITEGPTWPVA